MRRNMDIFFNCLSKEEAEVVRNLSTDQLEAAYRVRELEYRVEDAENHAEELYPGFFEPDDYEEMAIRYLDRQDCNVDENSMWESIVEEMADEKEMAKEKENPRPDKTRCDMPPRP